MSSSKKEGRVAFEVIRVTKAVKLALQKFTINCEARTGTKLTEGEAFRLILVGDENAKKEYDEITKAMKQNGNGGSK